MLCAFGNAVIPLTNLNTDGMINIKGSAPIRESLCGISMYFPITLRSAAQPGVALYRAEYCCFCESKYTMADVLENVIMKNKINLAR